MVGDQAGAPVNRFRYGTEFYLPGTWPQDLSRVGAPAAGEMYVIHLVALLESRVALCGSPPGVNDGRHTELHC